MKHIAFPTLRNKSCINFNYAFITKVLQNDYHCNILT